MKTVVVFIIYFVILCYASGVSSHSFTSKMNHEMPIETLDNCKTCTLIVEKFESSLKAQDLEKFKNMIDNFQPLCHSISKFNPDIKCDFMGQFTGMKNFFCGYLTNHCSNNFESISVRMTSNKSDDDVCDTCYFDVRTILLDIYKAIDDFKTYYYDYITPAYNEFCANASDAENEKQCNEFFSNLWFIVLYPMGLLQLAISKARFIWNAEISISVAIHCYERLF